MCYKCLAAFLLNSAQEYVEKNDLSIEDMLDAFVDASEWIDSQIDEPELVLTEVTIGTVH
jgi:hypothetical protein